MQPKSLLYIKISAVVVVAIILSFYFFHQAKAFLLGPQLTIDFPEDGQVLGDAFISVRGKTLNTVLLMVDGKQILTDSFGSFSKSLILAEGYNIIELSAKDKFDREINKKLKVVLNQNK
ncbi:hypothetical protein ACFLZC_00995 [Patescibacteria group bacterium]